MSDPFATPEELQETRAAGDRRAQIVATQLGRDYREVFGGRAGEAVLTELIQRFGGETYTRGDPHHTAWREGQRSVLEHIARSIARADPPAPDGSGAASL